MTLLHDVAPVPSHAAGSMTAQASPLSLEVSLRQPPEHATLTLLRACDTELSR
jgi:hypothetical protein